VLSVSGCSDNAEIAACHRLCGLAAAQLASDFLIAPTRLDCGGHEWDLECPACDAFFEEKLATFDVAPTSALSCERYVSP